MLQYLLAVCVEVHAAPSGPYPYKQSVPPISTWQPSRHSAVEHRKPPAATHVCSASAGVTLNHGIFEGSEQLAVSSTVSPGGAVVQ
jgi:hypothetical protein